MPLNLSGVTRFAESMMVSTCDITRDAGSYDDDTFSQATGQYSQPVGDTTTLYSGKCMIASLASFNTQAEGESDPEISLYDVFIPIDSTAVEKWDLVTITASPNDPNLVGAQFYVLSGEYEQFGVMRRIRAQRREASGQVDLTT